MNCEDTIWALWWLRLQYMDVNCIPNTIDTQSSLQFVWLHCVSSRPWPSEQSLPRSHHSRDLRLHQSTQYFVKFFIFQMSTVSSLVLKPEIRMQNHFGQRVKGFLLGKSVSKPGRMCSLFHFYQPLLSSITQTSLLYLWPHCPWYLKGLGGFPETNSLSHSTFADTRRILTQVSMGNRMQGNQINRNTTCQSMWQD